MRPLRDTLTLLSRTSPGRRLLRQVVAGERVEDVVRVVGELRAAGFVAGVERLGEPTGSVVAEHLTLIDRLSDAGLAAGTDITIGACSLDEARRICRAALGAGATVTTGADIADVDVRLALVAAVRAELPGMGVELNAALPRTEADCRALAGPGMRVRLVRGAGKDAAETDKAYVRCLKVLLGGAGHPVVATHDPRLIEIAIALASRYGRAPSTYEIQLPYGVRRTEQRRLAASGEQVRVRLAYGPEWHRYLMGRVAERPADLRLFVTSLVSGR